MGSVARRGRACGLRGYDLRLEAGTRRWQRARRQQHHVLMSVLFEWPGPIGMLTDGMVGLV